MCGKLEDWRCTLSLADSLGDLFLHAETDSHGLLDHRYSLTTFQDERNRYVFELLFSLERLVTRDTLRGMGEVQEICASARNDGG